MVVYYSGTGNSRYAAEMLADICGDEAVDSLDVMKTALLPKLCSDKPWVFVCPVYVSAPAQIFMSFLLRFSFSGCRRAYFIMTCAGGMGASGAYCEDICKKQGLDFMGTAQLIMPQNYLVFFNTKEKAENEQTIAAAGAHIAELARRVAEGLPFDYTPPSKRDVVSTGLILSPYYKYFMSAKPFFAGDSCIGCGLCAKLCPLGNIKLADGRPHWGNSCTHCMACISRCPKGAIEYGRKTAGKPRYVCPPYKRND